MSTITMNSAAISHIRGDRRSFHVSSVRRSHPRR
jgi:hypothetical protein